jgi:CheY-like chemotaxis protein
MVKDHILIVDHEPVLANRINSLLQQDGYETTVAYSSSDAVRCGPAFKPDLVIIDPIMPGISGVEAATQIAKATRSKILFLTTLSGDRDFRELLKGIRQQGFECGALPKPFTKEQLLNYVRREIGPAIVLTDALDNVPEDSQSRGKVSAQPRPSSRVAATTAPAKGPLGDYEPLFTVCNDHLYEKNAFRITGLNVDVPLREVAKEAEKLEMANKLGLAHVDSTVFPPRIAPDAAAIRAAFQALKDPEQRLMHEFFWFWPLARSSNEDGALSALREHSYDRAVSIWKEEESKDRSGVTTHNLAVYYHLAALEDELATAGATPKNDTSWRTSYQYWGTLLNRHAYWDRVVVRIREIADPRLTIDSAERIWSSLPTSLLSINARLAVAAAERADFEEAGRQRRLMCDSSLGLHQATEALRRALVPVKGEIGRLCSTAAAEALANPKGADSAVRQLFNDKKRLLQAFNYLLGLGDPMRDAAFDMVAQTGRTCLVAYTNETENWSIAQMLFEECLALAEGNALRARLEEDLDIIVGNLAAQRARQSQPQPAPPPRPAPTSSTPPPAARTIPSSRPSKGGWVIVVLIGFVVIVGMVKGCDDDARSRVTQPRPDTAASSVDQATPGSYSDTPSPSPPQHSSSTSWESTQLKSEIEEEKAHLQSMKNDLTSTQEMLDGYQTQIDSDKSRMRQIERDNQLGLSVDESEYEMIRQRHNNTVQVYNNGVAEYNHTLAEYKDLLRTTNEKIDRYNTLTKSR